MVDRFRAAGLWHLTAVSGQNVALLLAAAGPLLQRARPPTRWAATLALIGWFVVLTRAEPSVLRAGAMAALSATAFVLGRQAEPLRLLAVGVIGLLLFDPLLAWSVGFWLSVGATAGVTIGAVHLAPRLGRLGPLALPVAVTLGAQAGVAVPSLLVFGRLSLDRHRRQPGRRAGRRAGDAGRAAGQPRWPAPCRPSGRSSWRRSGGACGGSTRWRRSPPRPSRRRRGRGSGWVAVALVVVGLLRASRGPRCDDGPAMGVHLVTGGDESILRAAVTDLVHELVGDGDRSLMVDEFDGDDYELRSVVDAAQTPPFLTDRARRRRPRRSGASPPTSWRRCSATSATRCATTELVLVGGGGRLAKALTDAVKQAGGTATLDRSAAAGARPPGLDRRAGDGGRRAAVGAGRGGDRRAPRRGRRSASTACWPRWPRRSAPARSLKPEDVEPFLGEGGGVPPWELTDAIDGGDTAGGAGPAAADDRRRRAPPAAADGDPARPLRAPGPPRRRRRVVRGGGRRGARHQAGSRRGRR